MTKAKSTYGPTLISINKSINIFSNSITVYMCSSDAVLKFSIPDTGSSYLRHQKLPTRYNCFTCIRSRELILLLRVAKIVKNIVNKCVLFPNNSCMPICLINLGQGQTSVLFRNTVLSVCRDLLKLTYWFSKVSSDSDLLPSKMLQINKYIQYCLIFVVQLRSHLH